MPSRKPSAVQSAYRISRIFLRQKAACRIDRGKWSIRKSKLIAQNTYLMRSSMHFCRFHEEQVEVPVFSHGRDFDNLQVSQSKSWHPLFVLPGQACGCFADWSGREEKAKSTLRGNHCIFSRESEPQDRGRANPVRDSSCESSVVARGHEQASTPNLQDPELAVL